MRLAASGERTIAATTTDATATLSPRRTAAFRVACCSAVRPGFCARAASPESSPDVVALDAAAEGRSLEALLGSLSGVAVAHVRGGSIGGVEIESTLERLRDGNTVIAGGNAPFIPVTGRSAFESLRSYLVVKDGIARAARLRVDGDRYQVTLGGGGDLGRGEIEAEGVALLFESAQDGRRVDPAVRLPFGIGGTLARPMIAPGIPMVGHRPHAGRDRQRAYYDALASPLRIASSSVVLSDGADQPGPGTRSRRTDAGTSVWQAASSFRRMAISSCAGSSTAART